MPTEAGTPAAQLVLRSVDAGVATIAMNDERTRNALSDPMLDELLSAFRWARDADDVRCVVLASTHPKTFSAGGNLSGFSSDEPLVHKHDAIGKLPELFRLIIGLGKPVICRANGHVLAGSLGIALACDLIVAGESAVFGTPEINVGVFPFMIMALIYRNVGQKKATEMLLLGERFSASEAERLGLINVAVPDDELDDRVGAWAAKLAASSPLLVRMGKNAMSRQRDMPLDDAWDYLRAQLALAFSTEDVREGVAAFFEKRDPQWTGR